jgi:hypothetical protein
MQARIAAQIAAIPAAISASLRRARSISRCNSAMLSPAAPAMRSSSAPVPKR